jgi:hypothetical protein
MRAVKITILAAVTIALAGLAACSDKDKDTDEQQGSASKAVAGQQATAQKPVEKPDTDEDEEGEEGPATPLQVTGQQLVYNFDSDSAGKSPGKFHAARTGSGSGSAWVVMSDLTAPTKPNVVAQTSTDQTDYRFPLLIADEGSFQNLDLSVRFKAVSGSIDRAGGLVFRLKDPNNYYVVRANALENNSGSITW